MDNKNKISNKEKFDKKINSISKKIEIIDKKIEVSLGKINKLDIKKDELQKKLHYFILENAENTKSNDNIKTTNIKITAISDTHGRTPLLHNLIEPKSDLLLICGDISPCTVGHLPTRQLDWFHNTFIPWVENQANEVVFVAGNHDFFLNKILIDNEEDKFRKSLPKNVHYLRDSMVELYGIKIWGTPWTNIFFDWAFMLDETDLYNKYNEMPNEIDILLSHGPAYSLSDQILQDNGWDNGYDNADKSLGSKSLYKALETRKIKNFYYGHIHSADHDIKSITFPSGHTMKYNCVSILDERYSPTFVPYVEKIK
jgi:Icc-related predicted phosphoesterase